MQNGFHNRHQHMRFAALSPSGKSMILWSLSGIALAACGSFESATRDAVGKLFESTTNIDAMLSNNRGTTQTLPDMNTSPYTRYSDGDDNVYEATVNSSTVIVTGMLNDDDMMGLGSGAFATWDLGDNFAYDTNKGQWWYRNNDGDTNDRVDINNGNYKVTIILNFPQSANPITEDSMLVDDVFTLPPDNDDGNNAADVLTPITVLSGGEITIAATAATDSEGNQVLAITVAPITFAVNGGAPITIAAPQTASLASGIYRLAAEITQDGAARIIITEEDAQVEYLLGTLTIDTGTPANSGFIAAADTPPQATAHVPVDGAFVADMPDGDGASTADFFDRPGLEVV